MRPPEDMGYYVVAGEDGFPRAIHGIKRLMPEDAVEITKEQADAVSQDMRAREPKPIAEGQPAAPQAAAVAAPAVDLQPVLDKLKEHEDAIKTLAETAVDHASMIANQGDKVDAVHEAVTAHFEGLKNADPEPT